MSTKNEGKIEKIGERIKAFRIREKMTLVQLANLIGISHGSLSGLENNKSKPSAETLSNLCLYTDIDIEWLLTGNKSKKQGKPRILGELEDWISDEIKKDPKREDWFEIQLKDSFPAFKTWKEEKEESEAAKAYTSSRKVA